MLVNVHVMVIPVHVLAASATNMEPAHVIPHTALVTEIPVLALVENVHHMERVVVIVVIAHVMDIPALV